MANTIIAESFKKFKPIDEMEEVAFGNLLAWNMLKIQPNDPRNHLNDFLDFFTSGESWLADLEDFYHVFTIGEDDFTDLEVDLFFHKNFDLVNIPFDADILESCDCNVDNLLLR